MTVYANDWLTNYDQEIFLSESSVNIVLLQTVIEEIPKQNTGELIKQFRQISIKNQVKYPLGLSTIHKRYICRDFVRAVLKEVHYFRYISLSNKGRTTQKTTCPIILHISSHAFGVKMRRDQLSLNIKCEWTSKGCSQDRNI